MQNRNTPGYTIPEIEPAEPWQEGKREIKTYRRRVGRCMCIVEKVTSGYSATVLRQNNRRTGRGVKVELGTFRSHQLAQWACDAVVGDVATWDLSRGWCD